MVKDYIICDKTINRDCKEVWRYFTRSQHLQKWFVPGARIEPIIGGSFYEPWCDQYGNIFINCGRIVEIKRNYYLKIIWPEQDSNIETTLEIWFVAVRDKTKIKLKHSGFLEFDDMDGETLFAGYNRNWQSHLRNLQKYAERVSCI